MTVNFKIDPGFALQNEIRYALKVIGNNKALIFLETENGLTIGNSDTSQIRISNRFISNYTQKKFSWADNLNDRGFIELDNHEPDYLSTAFYMLASLQEYDPTLSLDNLGRFQFRTSYQSKLNLSNTNIVQHCFDKVAEQFSLQNYPVATRFFLSHDIDTVNESVLQDGLHVLKKGRLDIFFQLLFHVAMRKPDWLNMDLIMNIESEYDCRSTFFWIVKKGTEGNLKNADYDFQSSTIQEHVKAIEGRGFENGIHKSVSLDSFQNELREFQQLPIANRYHYLKFNLPLGYNAVEQSGLKIDASLGFAENIGFRNSYGLPFTPYNINKREPYSFVEVPLHVMDTTLFKYNRSSIAEAEKTIFDFFEMNRTNTILSVLWHNNFFSNHKYKGYLPLYKKILAYIKENNFKTISQEEIIDRYLIKK